MNLHVAWPNRAALQLVARARGNLPDHASPARRAEEPAAIAWREDYAGAMENARAGNRLLWIQFTGPWCPNCTRMERDSFPSPTIIEHSEALVRAPQAALGSERGARGGLQPHCDPRDGDRRAQPGHHLVPPGLSGPGRARRLAQRKPGAIRAGTCHSSAVCQAGGSEWTPGRKEKRAGTDRSGRPRRCGILPGEPGRSAKAGEGPQRALGRA